LNIQPYRSIAEMLESDPQRLGRAAGMSHSDVLQHVAESGAFGGAMLVLVLVVLVRKSAAQVKGQEDLGRFLLTAGLLGGALGAAGAGLVGNALHQPAVGALAMLFLGTAERAGAPSPQSRLFPLDLAARAGLILLVAGGALGMLVGLRWGVDDRVFARFLAFERTVEIDGSGPWAGDASSWLHDSMESSAPWSGLDRWDVRRSLGLIYLKTSHPRDRQRAVTHLERARALNPNDPETLNAWGVLCLREAKRDQGRQAFEQAVRLDPVVRQPRLNLALAYEQDGKPDQALAHYEALVKLDPRDAEAHLWRGLTLVRLGRHAEAAKAFTEAEQADRHTEPVRRFGLRGTMQRDDTWRAFRESEAGRAWLGGKRE
jgi:tetratricopeptide (TPR) repeat protein